MHRHTWRASNWKRTILRVIKYARRRATLSSTPPKSEVKMCGFLRWPLNDSSHSFDILKLRFRLVVFSWVFSSTYVSNFPVIFGRPATTFQDLLITTKQKAGIHVNIRGDQSEEWHAMTISDSNELFADRSIENNWFVVGSIKIAKP